MTPPLLLMALLASEAAHWHLIRQKAYVALLEAARAGATQHGHPQIIARTFSQFMQDAGTTAPSSPAAAAPAARTSPWRIEILQPTAAAVRAHARSGLGVPGAHHRAAASNDYQAEQHAKRPGAAGQTIYDANTLQLRLLYGHQPLSPLTRAVLRQAAASAGPCTRRLLGQGMLALQLELRIEMESHPVDWQAAPSVRHDRVGYGAWDCTRDTP